MNFRIVILFLCLLPLFSLAQIDTSQFSLTCYPAFSVDLTGIDENNDGKRDSIAGFAIVNAKDLVDCEQQDCPDSIIYTIERAIEIDSGAVAFPSNTSLIIDCEDVCEVVVLVYIYSWHNIQKIDSCAALIIVEDDLDICCDIINEPSIFSGIIYTEDKRAVPNVEVKIDDFNTSFVTSNKGNYFFTIGQVIKYTILPSNNQNHRNGVSTADIIQISRHLLGLEQLDSPYKMIAADVNNSGSITTLDLIKMRRIIIGMDKEFENNSSWRFVDADYVFPDPKNPWKVPFPESIEVGLESNTLLDGDFIGIKIGDVNLSSEAGDLIQPR